MSWKGTTALVTGGASGIGRAVCEKFAAAGANVAVADRNGELAAETARRIASEGGNAMAVTGDVSVEDDVKRMFAEAAAAFGPVNVLVNGAAVCPQIRLTDLSLAEWNRVLSVNLTGAFLCCREAVPYMLRSGGGAIVNIASVHAAATLDGYAAYAASKGGIVAMTRAIALDYAKERIRVNAVLPGAIQTPMLEASVKSLDTPREQIMEAWNASQPVGRIGQPEEVAAVVLFAASADNSFMTGSVLTVDGGMTADL